MTCCKNVIITNKILDDLPKSVVIITICTFEVTKKYYNHISNKISTLHMEIDCLNNLTHQAVLLRLNKNAVRERKIALYIYKNVIS